MFDFVHKKRGSHFCEPLYCLCFDFFMFITSYHLVSSFFVDAKVSLLFAVSNA